MTPDPQSNLPRKTARVSDTTRNLEFDFNAGGSSMTRPAPVDKTTGDSRKKTNPFPPNPPRKPTVAQQNTSQPKTEEQEIPTPVQSQTSTQPRTMSNSPFSQFQQNVHRQTREQRAVSSILSGVAITLLSIIVGVALLAGFGGWVLWRQIQNQSVTVAQIDARFTEEAHLLGQQIKDLAATQDQLNALTQAQKQQITWLQNQLEQTRNQSRKDLAAALARLQKLETRVYDIERRPSWSR